MTAACMVCRKDAFEAIGGFDAEHLPVAYNDVDLCLKLRKAGLRILWTPYAELHHHESATRGYDADGGKLARLKRDASVMQEFWG